MDDEPKKPTEQAKQPAMTKAQARQSGYTGDLCNVCGSVQMRRNGSCLVCDACGTTTGCS